MIPPPPSITLLELDPPAFTEGDLDGQDGWTTDAGVSMVLVGTGGSQVFAGTDAAATQSRNQHDLADFSTQSSYTLRFHLDSALDGDFDAQWVMIIENSGSFVFNLLLELDYSSGTNQITVHLGDDFGESTAVVGPTSADWRVEVTNNGEDFEVFRDNVSLATYHNGTPISFADADSFIMYCTHAGGANHWLGSSLTLTAT